MSEKNERVHNLKSVMAEIQRVSRQRDKKTEKVRELNAEIKADNARLKELKNTYDQLQNESLQQQIADAWFKEEKLSGEQIAKFLELSRQLKEKIDVLDVETIVKAVNTIEPEKQKEKVDTYITNSGNVGGSV
ncbi:MAG: hypothetical protein E7493_04775 [Ruminococcus albus]|nr:hypothetical protein [Ruminococcus albus]